MTLCPGAQRKQPLPELPAGADPTTLPYLKTAPLLLLQSNAALFFPHGTRTTVGTPSVTKFRCPRPHIVHSSRCVPFAQSHVHTHGSDIPTRTPGGSQCGSRKEKSSSPPSAVVGAMQLKRLSQWQRAPEGPPQERRLGVRAVASPIRIPDELT